MSREFNFGNLYLSVLVVNIPEHVLRIMSKLGDEIIYFLAKSLTACIAFNKRRRAAAAEECLSLSLRI